MKFSVSIHVEGDREVTLEEVIELANDVARMNVIASCYDTMGYGAQIYVCAVGYEKAVEKAIQQFTQALE